jgi:hypothetical protein
MQDTFPVRFLNNASFTKNCTLTNWLLLQVRKSSMLQILQKKNDSGSYAEINSQNNTDGLSDYNVDII